MKKQTMYDDVGSELLDAEIQDDIRHEDGSVDQLVRCWTLNSRVSSAGSTLGIEGIPNLDNSVYLCLGN